MVSEYYIQDNSDIESKKWEAAQAFYTIGDYSAALKLYLDMVNTSFSYKLHYEIGRCYYKLGDFNNAETYFIQSINLESKRNPSYLYMGNLCSKRNELNNAIEHWSKAFVYKPNDENVCLNLATSYFSKNMRLQAVIYYKKFLKYAKDKTSKHYNDIKSSITEFTKIGDAFYKKAQEAISKSDNETAMQALTYAVQNNPTNFDINYLLGKLYIEESKYLQAVMYLKQAYCIDTRSLDVLQLLSTAMINAGDYTGAYCCLKRILPLVLNHQKEYLEVIKTIQSLENSFDNISSKSHREWAEKYYKDNNYLFALFEYENCFIIDGNTYPELSDKIDTLKSIINPEARIIKLCFEKGGVLYSNGDYKQSNKYFSKIMSLSEPENSDYKLAKSRIINV